MARIFITGSSDGLGLMAAETLISMGHEVVLHARNEKRAKQTLEKIPDVTVLTGDLSTTKDTIDLASKVNALGNFDAVIHNAGVYTAPSKEIFSVNTLAPYILTCLIKNPHRLIYLTSGLHLQGKPRLESFISHIDRITYSDSKLHVVMLCKAVARKWPDVYANTVNPGWVPTKMGGKGAPDDLQKGYETQVWLAVSNDDKAKVSGSYFFHKQQRTSNPEADDVELQEKFLEICKKVTGIPLS